MAIFDSQVSKFFLNDGTTSQDMSAYIAATDGLPGERSLSNVTTFGSVGNRWNPSLQNVEFSLDLVYSEDAASTGGSDFILGPMRTATSSRAFSYYPSGTTGKLYSGNCWVLTYVILATVRTPGDTAVKSRATLRVDNGVTRT